MKSVKELLREYGKNKDELENVNLKFGIFKRKKEKEIEKIENKLIHCTSCLRDKIEKIEGKGHEKTRKVKNKIERRENARKWAIEKINRKISDFERIVNILKDEKIDAGMDLRINNDDAVFYPYYSERELKWVEGYLFDDKFMKIRLLICRNRNPVNMFSVVAVGVTSFKEYLKGNIYSYGTDLKLNGNPNILIVVKTFPRMETAERWTKKKKKYILSDLICQYNEFKAKYLKIIKKYRDNDNLMELIQAKEMAEKL